MKTETIRQRYTKILNDASNNELIMLLHYTVEEIQARRWLGKLKVTQ